MDLQEFQRLDIPNFFWYTSGYLVPHEIPEEVVITHKESYSALQVQKDEASY